MTNQATQQTPSPEAVEAAGITLPRTLKEADPNLQQQALAGIINNLTAATQAEDFIREIRVHPEDVEIVKDWLAKVEMPPIVRQLLSVTANDGSTCLPSYLQQSMIERQWLQKYFAQQGLMDALKQKQAPLILSHKEMKALFLQETLLALREQRRIIVPGL